MFRVRVPFLHPPQTPPFPRFRGNKHAEQLLICFHLRNDSLLLPFPLVILLFPYLYSSLVLLRTKAKYSFHFGDKLAVFISILPSPCDNPTSSLS